jgi:hypothetical protein
MTPKELRKWMVPVMLIVGSTLGARANELSKVEANHIVQLILISAKTGKTEWSVKEAVGDIIVGHFQNTKKQAVAVRSGGTLRCYDDKGKLIWKPETGLKGGNAYAHEAYRYDANGDGLDQAQNMAVGDFGQ